GPARQQSGAIYWVDGQFSLPGPAIGAAGSRQTLTTSLTRQSNGSPIAGWIVRYEVIGGPAAGFGPSRTTAVEVPTDAQGRACAEISQAQPINGANQVDVQVIRPAASPADRLVIG